MSSTETKIERKLSFTAKGTEEENKVEWIAFKAKLLARAQTKKLTSTFKKGTTHEDEGKASSSEECINAWTLLIECIDNDNLVVELYNSYVDEEKDAYDPRGAFQLLNERFGGKPGEDLARVEATWDAYLAILKKGLPRIPTEVDLTDTFNKLNTFVDNLNGTHRKIKKKSVAYDLLRLVEPCHADIYRGVHHALGKAENSDKIEDPKAVEAIIKHAVALETRRLARVEHAEESELSALKAQVAELKAMSVAREAKSIHPRGNPRDTFKTIKNCDTCGLKHAGLCERDPKNLDKVDWSKVPKNRMINKTIAEQAKQIEDLNKKLSLSAKMVQLKTDDIVLRIPEGEGPTVSSVTAMFRGDPTPLRCGIDSKAIGGCFFSDMRAFPFGITNTSQSVELADGFYSKIIGTGTAVLIFKDEITGKDHKEYIPDSFLVEGFNQPLLGVDTLQKKDASGRMFRIDLQERVMITRTGATVSIDKLFDVPASYASSDLIAKKSVAEPMLSPTDLVSRGKKEPKVIPALTITDAELKTIELHMRRLGIPNVQRLRIMPDIVEGLPDILKKTPLVQHQNNCDTLLLQMECK
jgi:hypothetical protein